MKTVYFVRHAEGEKNTSNRWVTNETGLTEKGREQAQFIASRCEKLPVDVIISSTWQRAQETAKIINSRINKPLVLSDLFVERKWPSEQTGLLKDSRESQEIEKIIWNSFSNPEIRHSDEENFMDLKERIEKALVLLENRPEENILVVTHGFILRIILACIVMGEELTAPECDQFVDKFHTKNTGLTVVQYGKTEKRTRWHLSIWNDHSHLAD
jgi:probable phosphoglycerate mutase